MKNKNLIKTLLREEINNVNTYYHGSEGKIDRFVDDFVGGKEAVDQEGPGIYFTNQKEETNYYGQYVYTVEINTDKFIKESPNNKANITKMITKLVKMVPDWESEAQNYDENPSIGLRRFIESTLRYNNNTKECLLQIWISFYKNNPKEFVKNCVSLGINGIIINKGNFKHLVVYNPAIIRIKND